MAKTQTLDTLIAAATRLKSLQTEIAQIEAEFPSLAGLTGESAPRRRGRPPSLSAAALAAQPTKRKRHKMSAAARKAIGDAQRRRWAKQKAEAKKG